MTIRDRRPFRLASSLALLAALAAGCGGGDSARKPVETGVTHKVRLAQSLMKAGRVGDALAAVDEAILQEPDNAGVYYFRGQLCFDSGRLEEAESAFRKTLALDPYMTDAHNYLGAIYQEQDRLGEAETEYRRALDNPAYPSPEKAYLGLGLLFASQAREREAIDAFRKAVEINPKFYGAHFELASALERVGNLDEAIREYEVAEPGYRNYGTFYYRLGLTYFRLGERQRAKETLSRVQIVAPGSESAAQADELLKMLD